MDITEKIKLLQDALDMASLPKPRTAEEFVNDMSRRDRTLKQILIVASCTRWKGMTKK